MVQQDRKNRMDQTCSAWNGPSEPESHTEHQAALNATLFRPSKDSRELVLVLDAGQLRARRPRES